jgi:hypothetical protein
MTYWEGFFLIIFALSVWEEAGRFVSNPIIRGMCIWLAFLPVIIMNWLWR